jgi:predicted nucleic acid-binding protein
VGTVSPPSSGATYIDANVLIYSVERVAPYISALDAFWQQISAQQRVVLSSELTTLEVLVGPLRAGDTALETLFRRALFASPDLGLIPVSRAVLERAAQLRASLPGLKTPDAIHAATALEANCALVVTNDPVFRRIPGLTVQVLRDVLPP